MKSKSIITFIFCILAVPAVCSASTVKPESNVNASCQIIKPADLSKVLYNDLYCCAKSGSDRLNCLNENIIIFRAIINHAANMTNKLNSAAAAAEIRNKMTACAVNVKKSIGGQMETAKCYYNVYYKSAEPHLNMAIDECTP